MADKKAGKVQESHSGEPKKGLKNNWIVRNLVGAAIFVAAILLVSNLLLGLVTRHGRTVTVPDLTNQTWSEAKYNAGKAGLRVEISDSVFVRRMKAGAVFSQNPAAGSQVKRGRRILLTTNAIQAKKVKMPLVVGYSMRQAKAELSSKGLALGKLIYVDDIATNNVIRQLYNGSEIKPGRLILSGSRIDLVVGLNPADGRTYAPNVIGMKYLRAIDAVQDNSLNITRTVFDKGVSTYSDSVSAFVYRQTPESTGIPLTMGAGVTLYLTNDTSKLPK